MQQSTSFRDDPDLDRIASIRAEAQKEVGRHLTEARRLRFQRALLLGVITVLSGSHLEDALDDLLRYPPPSAPHADATVVVLPLIYCDLDLDEGPHDQIRMRCWTPSSDPLFRLTPPGHEIAACTRGINCPVHRSCLRHPPTSLFNPFPFSPWRDAGLSSQ